jgi:hypothetical protein
MRNDLEYLDQLGDESYLLSTIKEKKPVDRIILARYLRQSAGKRVPKKVIEYVCLVIEGKAKPRRGRRPTSHSVKMWRIFRYDENLRWLERRSDIYHRLPRFKSSRAPKSMNPKMPLHEVAARMINNQQRLFGIRTFLDPRTIRNMSSAFWREGRLANQKPTRKSRSSPKSS